MDVRCFCDASGINPLPCCSCTVLKSDPSTSDEFRFCASSEGFAWDFPIEGEEFLTGAPPLGTRTLQARLHHGDHLIGGRHQGSQFLLSVENLAPQVAFEKLGRFRTTVSRVSSPR